MDRIETAEVNIRNWAPWIKLANARKILTGNHWGHR